MGFVSRELLTLVVKNRNSYLILLMSIFNGLGFGLQLPSLYSYSLELDVSPKLYSFVVAILSVGELIGAILCSTLYDRINQKGVLVFASLVGCVLNLSYAMAQNGWMLLLGRLGLGFWYGALNGIIRLEINALGRQLVPHLIKSNQKNQNTQKNQKNQKNQRNQKINESLTSSLLIEEEDEVEGNEAKIETESEMENRVFGEIIGGLQSFFAIFVCVSMAVSPYIGGVLDTDITFQTTSVVQFNIFTWPGWILSACGLICSFAVLILKNTGGSPPSPVVLPTTPTPTPSLAFKQNKSRLLSDDSFNRERDSNPSNPNSMDQSEISHLLEQTSFNKPKSKWSLWENNDRPNWIVWNTIFAFFVSSLGFTAIETMATPYLQDQLAVEVEDTSIVFLVGGIANVVVFVLMLFLPAVVLDFRVQIIFSSLMSVIGCLFLINWKGLIHAPLAKDDPCQMFTCAFPTGINNYPCINETLSNDLCQDKNCLAIGLECETCLPICLKPALTLTYTLIMVGFAVINVGFPPGRVGSGSYYSALLGAKKQGFMQGLLVSSGSVARIVGPIIVNGVYTASDHQPWTSSLLLAVIFSLPLVLWAIPFKRLALNKPQNDPKGDNTKANIKLTFPPPPTSLK